MPMATYTVTRMPDHHSQNTSNLNQPPSKSTKHDPGSRRNLLSSFSTSSNDLANEHLHSWDRETDQLHGFEKSVLPQTVHTRVRVFLLIPPSIHATEDPEQSNKIFSEKLDKLEKKFDSFEENSSASAGSSRSRKVAKPSREVRVREFLFLIRTWSEKCTKP